MKITFLCLVQKKLFFQPRIYCDRNRRQELFKNKKHCFLKNSFKGLQASFKACGGGGSLPHLKTKNKIYIYIYIPDQNRLTNPSLLSPNGGCYVKCAVQMIQIGCLRA